MRKNLTAIIPAAIILFGFVTYNFMNAAWTPPPAAPPTSNTEAPVNVGTTDQVKNGGLSVDALSVTGNTNVTGTSTITGIYGLNVTSAGPRIKMTNTTVGSTDWWLHNSGSSFYLIADRDGNGNWTTPAENPWPMQVVASTTSTGDFVSFSNKVRANEYCERNGGNCFAAADVGTAMAGGIGVGQTWQDVTGSRISNTIYQNTTGKPIQIIIDLNQDISYVVMVANSTGPFMTVGNGDGNAGIVVSAIIPNNGRYIASSFSRWHELR